MSVETEKSYQSFACCGGAWRGSPRWRWTPIELIAMVLGFVVFWPIGLAILGWKLWQRNSGYQGDLVAFGREKWGASSHWRGGFAQDRWQGGGLGSTGNAAFDEWRANELARLEEERQKLVQAEREFADFMEHLRRARDREEFDRFMNERRSRSGEI